MVLLTYVSGREIGKECEKGRGNFPLLFPSVSRVTVNYNKKIQLKKKDFLYKKI